LQRFHQIYVFFEKKTASFDEVYTKSRLGEGKCRINGERLGIKYSDWDKVQNSIWSGIRFAENCSKQRFFFGKESPAVEFISVY
jgi:hypothetical protein